MSVPIQNPDIRAVYLKDKRGVRSNHVSEKNIPPKLREIRRKLEEHWRRIELQRTAA